MFRLGSRRRRNQHVLRFLAVAVGGTIPLSSPAASEADDLFHLLDNSTNIPTLSHYGGVGLLDTRTARFLPDGTLAATVLIKNPDDRISGTFQVFPWLETTFRWSNNYAIRPASEPGQGADRSFDLKVRLSREGEIVPELAIGLQDFLGTGIYGGEYLVGSKRFGRFDVSLGLGWGRLGSRGTFHNPIGGTREQDAGQGGTLTGDYFQGPDLGIFGGIEYRPRIHNVKIQLEYSSDSYRQEKLASGKDYGFPVNVGLSYRPWPGVDLGLSYMHGREIGVRVSFFTDLSTDNSAARIDPLPPLVGRDPAAVEQLNRQQTQQAQQGGVQTQVEDLTAMRAQPAPQAPAAAPGALPTSPQQPGSQQDAIARMRQALTGQLLIVRGLTIEGSRVRVAVVNETYLRDAEAVSRAARALSATAPIEIEEFEIVTSSSSVPIGRVVFHRSELDRLAREQSSPAELMRASELTAPPTSIAEVDDPNYRRFTWNVFPMIRQSIFDPDNPYYIGLGIGSSQKLEIGRGLWLGASESILLYDTFDQIRRTSNSTLPHVRSDIAEYLKEGRYGFDSLQASYFFKLAPEVYGRTTVGYLEEMFAGVGGELLYRPFGRRWALGANLWAVQQRGFERLFALRDYKTLTGHVSLYYETPWNNISLRMHAGRYLAGDYGYTLEAVRVFNTGVQVGAWFTITNVSAQQFGEGSFDKGIMIRIPLEWVVPFGSRSALNLDLRPIQRDGGQRLNGAQELYEMTQSSSYGDMLRQWDSVFRQ